MMNTQQIGAAKALVRASYHNGTYIGVPALHGHVSEIAAQLRHLHPAGPIDQEHATELLGSGAPVAAFEISVA